jgi:hypothetical protein
MSSCRVIITCSLHTLARHIVASALPMMYHQSLFSVAFAALCGFITLAASVKASAPILVAQFPTTVWLENLVALSNGTILVCDAPGGTIYSLDPLSPTKSPNFIHHFTDSTSIFGITNPTQNTVAVSASNFSFATSSSAPGTNNVYLLEFGRHGEVSKVKKFPVPTATWLNGITTVPGKPHFILMADCEAGAVLRLDTRDGAVVTVSTDPLLSQPGGPLALGINGLHVYEGNLYFTNTLKTVFGKLAITTEGLSKDQPAEVVASAPTGSFFDDFSIGPEGTSYVAVASPQGQNGIISITLNGTSAWVATWEPTSGISQATSTVFGRTARDRKVLYFSTASAYFQIPLPPIGGQVFALNLKC